MTLTPIICYRCSECNRIYEEQPKACICARQVYIAGERFGPFIVVEGVGENKIRVKCLLCGNFVNLDYTNIKKQQSCGCKPRSAEVMDQTSEVLVYRCRKCGKTRTVMLPIAMYCCEDVEDEDGD